MGTLRLYSSRNDPDSRYAVKELRFDDENNFKMMLSTLKKRKEMNNSKGMVKLVEYFSKREVRMCFKAFTITLIYQEFPLTLEMELFDRLKIGRYEANPKVPKTPHFLPFRYSGRKKSGILLPT